jgi:transposase
MVQEEEIKQRYERIVGDLTERTRRLYAANEALSLGWGGISAVSRATGISRQVISDGMQELQGGKRAEEGRVRRQGGGRKSNVSKDPKLYEDLEQLVEPVSRGDPQSPLQWTSKSVRKLAKDLQGMGHQVSHELVSELLHALGYSLQANRKTQEGGTRADRNAQFEHRNAQAAAFVAAGEPAVSVDAKKKELVGDFKNPGRGWQPQGEPEQVRVYDFPIKGLG